jgi:hypothetical protein
MPHASPCAAARGSSTGSRILAAASISSKGVTKPLFRKVRRLTSRGFSSLTIINGRKGEGDLSAERECVREAKEGMKRRERSE